MIKKVVAFIGVSVVVIGSVVGGSLYAVNNAYESRVAMEKNTSKESVIAEVEAPVVDTVIPKEQSVEIKDEPTAAPVASEPVVEKAPFVYETYATERLASAGITADYGSFQQVLRIVYGFNWSETGDNAEAEARAIVEGMINPGKETLKKAGVIDPNLEATLKFYAIRNYIITSGQFFQVGIEGARTLKQ